MKKKSSERDLKKIEAYRQTLKRAFGTSDLRKVAKMLDEIDEEAQRPMFYVA